MASKGSGSSRRDLELVRVVEPTLVNSSEIFESILGDYPSKLKLVDQARLRIEY